MPRVKDLVSRSKTPRQWELRPDAGPHVHKDAEGNRVIYEPGEVVEDERDLDAMFPSKFVEVGKTKGPIKKHSKLKAANAFLDEEKDEDEVEVPDVSDDEDSDSDEEEAEHKPLGKDVTAKFPLAAKSDLKVFKTGKGKDVEYIVADADEPDTAISDGLKKLKAVEKFLKDYRKGN